MSVIEFKKPKPKNPEQAATSRSRWICNAVINGKVCMSGNWDLMVEDGRIECAVCDTPARFRYFDPYEKPT